MRNLLASEEKTAISFMHKATQIANKATCTRSKCGCIIVKDEEIIGEGYNSPPLEKESQRRCAYEKDSYHKKVTDKTCCVHAEQRAIMHALQTNADKINGARLYFIRLDAAGNPSFAGNPYCTICSKMALDVGITEFVLWHEKGVCVYDTEEYNSLSYAYHE